MFSQSFTIVRTEKTKYKNKKAHPCVTLLSIKGSVRMHESETKSISEIIHSTQIQEDMKLEHLVTTLSVEYDDFEAKNIICEFCLHSSSDKTLKYGMEYFYLNGYYEELQLLIAKNKESENESNRKWAAVYELSLERYINTKTLQPLSYQHILKQADRIKTDEPALICVIEFLKLGVYNQLSEFGPLGNFLDKQPRLFDQVEDTFLRKSFQIRLYQTLFMYHWIRNESIVARKYAFQVLNLSSNVNVVSNIHINLALTYTFDTYNQGMYHLNEALAIAEKNNLRDNIYSIKNHNIPFLSAHFKQVEGKEFTTTDNSERAHIEIAKGNLEKAKNILRGEKIDSPFKQYYLGLAKQDRDILLKSYTYFIEKRSDYFFS